MNKERIRYYLRASNDATYDFAGGAGFFIASLTGTIVLIFLPLELVKRGMSMTFLAFFLFSLFFGIAGYIKMKRLNNLIDQHRKEEEHNGRKPKTRHRRRH